MKLHSSLVLPLFGLLISGPSVAGGTVLGQQGTAGQVGQACTPMREGDSRRLVPVFYGVPASAELQASVRLGYRQFYGEHHDAAARATLLEARTRAVAEHNPCAEALAVYGLAVVAENSSFKDAPELLDAALRLFTQTGSTEGTAQVHFVLGRVYSTQSKAAESAEEYLLAIKEFDEAGDTASRLIAQMGIERHTNRNFAPIAAEARAHQLPCVEAQIHQFWADERYIANDYQQAMEQDVIADDLLTRCPGSGAVRAGVQTSMGRLERQQGRPKVALEHYKIALRLQMESGELTYVPQTYNAMAIAYDHLDDLAHAIQAYKNGLAVARQIHSQPFIDFLEANLGSTYAKHGQFALSIPLLEHATQNITSEHLLCVRLTQLGNAYANAGQRGRGIATLQRGLALCRAQKEFDEVEQGLEDLAHAEVASNLYDDALRDAHEGLALLEQRRAHLVPADAYKQGFITENRQLYEDAIAALTALRRPDEALEAAEQARARAFLDLLGSHAADSEADGGAKPTPVRGLARYRQDLIESPNSIAPLTTAAMLESAERLHSTLLVYWISPDALYIWVARPGKAVTGVVRTVSSDRLTKLVAATRPGAQTNATSPAAWARLYQTLIAPVADALPKEEGSLLTIVPSGPLFALSFAALLGPDGRYLAERYRSHVIPSVGLLAFTQRNAELSSALSPRFLFVDSPLHLPQVGAVPLPPLPGSAAEVNAIVKLLPADEVVRLSGSAATAEGLRNAAAKATTLHFATHAVLNDADPYASFLALDDTHHDGRLTVADIYALDLHSRTVVLSACSTGLGKVTGDGVAGLSRAFFYAGAASVLATLWDIADEPTAKLLPRFYAGLEAGQQPSTALRAAQLSMLRDLRRGKIRVDTLAGPQVLTPDPIYWASFSLAGEP